MGNCENAENDQRKGLEIRSGWEILWLCVQCTMGIRRVNPLLPFSISSHHIIQHLAIAPHLQSVFFDLYPTTTYTRFATMLFTTLASVAAFAGSALAVPPPPTGTTVYTITAEDSMFPKDNFFPSLTAAHSKLWLNNTNQDANCAGVADLAFFRLDDKTGSLFLYGNNKSRPVQQLFVLPGEPDSYGVGYVTGATASPPAGMDLSGWKIDSNGNLVWRDVPFLSCPNNADGSWSVYLNKNGNPGCAQFTAKALKAQYPNECEYTQ